MLMPQKILQQMKVAIICIFSTISILILLTHILQFFLFSQHAPQKTFLLPRTCLSDEDSTLLCYSCLRRDISPQLKSHTVQVNSSEKFNYIVFEKATNYSCDELFQMIQPNSYFKGGVLKIQYLQSVYDTLIALKAKAYRIPDISFNLLPNQYQTLIVQRIQKIKTKQSYLRATTISLQTDKIMRLGLQYLIIFSISVVLLVELLKLYHNIGIDYTFIIKIIIAVLCLIRIKRRSNIIVGVTISQFETVLFYVALLWSHTNFSYFIPFISINFLFSQPQWILISEICMIIPFIHSFVQIKSLKEDKGTLHIFTVFLLFITDKYKLSIEPKYWETIPHTLIYWLILLYSPSVNSIITIWDNLKIKQKQKQHKKMSLIIRQDQRDIILRNEAH